MNLSAQQPTVDMLVLEALVYKAEAFETGDDVNAADLVEWFADWRERLKAAVSSR